MCRLCCAPGGLYRSVPRRSLFVVVGQIRLAQCCPPHPARVLWNRECSVPRSARRRPGRLLVRLLAVCLLLFTLPLLVRPAYHCSEPLVSAECAVTSQQGLGSNVRTVPVELRQVLARSS